MTDELLRQAKMISEKGGEGGIPHLHCSQTSHRSSSHLARWTVCTFHMWSLTVYFTVYRYNPYLSIRPFPKKWPLLLARPPVVYPVPRAAQLPTSLPMLAT